VDETRMASTPSTFTRINFDHFVGARSRILRSQNWKVGAGKVMCCGGEKLAPHQFYYIYYYKHYCWITGVICSTIFELFL